MIHNNLISSKTVIAKIIADLDMKEEDMRITDIKEYIGEAIEKIGAVQQLEHKVVVLPIKNYQAKLPCDLYRLGQVAFAFEDTCGWLPMRKVTNSFGIYKKCNKDNVCNPKMCVKDNALIPLVKNLYNLVEDSEAIQIMNSDSNIRKTLSALVNSYTIPSNNGRLILGNPAVMNSTLQYMTKPGYIEVNVPEGFVKVAYYAIITDEDGMPMIPDMPSYTEAIFWYVTMKLSYPKYLKGQMNQNVYYDMRNSWNFYRKQAYAEAMMPDIGDIQSIKNEYHKLYPEHNDHDEFFEYTGDPQIIYNQNRL